MNFKNYKEAVGNSAVTLSRICARVSQETKIRICPVVSPIDLYAVAMEVGGEVWLQHVDGIEYGAKTGWILPELAISRGAHGVVINHSERKMINDEIRKAVTRCKEVGLSVCVCADSVEEAERLAILEPDFVAYEPPELIGSRDRSVSSEKGKEIEELVVRLGKQELLIGAGVHSVEDVRGGIAMGAKGVLVASDIVLAADPYKELSELAGAF